MLVIPLNVPFVPWLSNCHHLTPFSAFFYVKGNEHGFKLEVKEHCSRRFILVFVLCKIDGLRNYRVNAIFIIMMYSFMNYEEKSVFVVLKYRTPVCRSKSNQWVGEVDQEAVKHV